jgi:hypothetical protein
VEIFTQKLGPVSQTHHFFMPVSTLIFEVQQHFNSFAFNGRSCQRNTRHDVKSPHAQATPRHMSHQGEQLTTCLCLQSAASFFEI